MPKAKGALGKLTFSTLLLVICFIPTLLYLGVHSILNPDGFFAEFFVLSIGLYFLGTVQFILIVFLIPALISIWSS